MFLRSLLFVSLFLLPMIAAADGGAPSTTQGDGQATLLNLPEIQGPKVQITEGEISISEFPARMTMGRFSDSSGRTGVTLHIEGHKTIYLLGDSSTDNAVSSWSKYSSQWVVGAVRLDAGLKLRWDAQLNQTPGRTRFQFESPRLALGAIEESDPNVKNKHSHFTSYATAVSAAYQHNEITPLGQNNNVVDFEFLSSGFHHAFKLNGVNIDYCLQAAGVLQQGEIRNGNQKNQTAYGLRALACMGVQVGSLFNLRDEVQIQSLWRSTGRELDRDGKPVVDQDSYFPGTHGYALSIMNSVRLDRIANSPVGLEWTMTRESTTDGGPTTAGQTPRSVTQHIFGITGSF